MKYFSKIVMIRYVCGHKKLGIDTYQSFVTENKIKCPKCCKVSNKDTAKQIFREWEKACGKFAIAMKLVKNLKRLYHYRGAGVADALYFSTERKRTPPLDDHKLY